MNYCPIAVVITGGNTGLGLESAKRLAAAGATIVLTSRDAIKGDKAAEEVVSYVKANGEDGGKVMVANLDLCDLDNVKSFKGRLEKMIGDKKVDVLMNNAGVMAIPDKQMTKDGFEKTFQTNHLVSTRMKYSTCLLMHSTNFSPRFYRVILL